jgi:beta-aspartyl-peptidase (threonine type)
MLGYGSSLTSAGTVECDAIVMDGRTLNAGAVAGVQRIRHPISLARAVMDKTEHCLLIATGAEDFAREVGIELVANESLVHEWAQVCETVADLPVLFLLIIMFTIFCKNFSKNYFSFESQKRLNAYKTFERTISEDKPRNTGAIGGHGSTPTTTDSPLSGGTGSSEHDTVGAVAVDSRGNCAVATSTGGITAKRVGRVGDSPIVGAGGYADNTSGAVSTTGTGALELQLMISD